MDTPQATPLPTLHEASRALWLATLSLMTAFMHTQAPAHRYLIARRIARNFETLTNQDCFPADCRQRFARLGARWHRHADRLQGRPEPGVLERALAALGLR